MGGLGSGRQPNETRRQEVIRLRGEGLSQGEIGCRLGVTRQRVEQIVRAIQRDRSRSVACRLCGAVVAPPGTAPPDAGLVLCLACLERGPAVSFGERLRTCRTAAGLRLSELARKVGITPVTLRHYETDQREPRWRQLNLLLRVLGPALVLSKPEAIRETENRHPERDFV